jgi:alpha-beta hydrolase superfamily lysophospholipase
MCKNGTAFFQNRQGLRFFIESWMPEGRPLRAIVQIAHGMRESTGYYREFCTALAGAGYGSVIHDARGHGRTAGAPGSRDFARDAGRIGENGFDAMVDDLAEITGRLRREHPRIPVVLLGHSMGSVLARLYAARYGRKIDGLIYSGTTGPADPARTARLLAAAQEEAGRRGAEAEAADTPSLFFGRFNDRFQPAETGCEYMSRDKEMVRQAVASPYAAVPYRCGFYLEFIRAIRRMDAPELLEKIPKELPIFSISGDMDPFGEYGKGVKALFELYRLHEIKNASYRLYGGGRHEMLREINRREVFGDVIGWLDAL